MPELPEVETTRRGVSPHVVGAKVNELIVRQPRLRWPIPDDLVDHIQGQPLLAVERRAKYLLFNFAAGTMMVHLGMSGRLCVIPNGQEAGKHDHVDIEFDNGQCLRFTDPRRFGAVLWSENPAAHDLISHLGPEPLTGDFDAQRLYQLSRGKTQAVKTFIMDSQVVVGVGNIYANEALFMAGILPSRPAGKISLKRYEALTEAIKTVLAKAIEQGGTTLRDFLGSDGKPGYFKQELHVYGRKGEPCIRCARVLKESRLGQRSTVYCTHCQK